MKEEVKELWHTCFTDSQEFIDLYFRMRYKEEENIAIMKDCKPVSALQMIPYPMTFYSKIWHTAYVSGACTHPDYRSKGVMRQLLSNAYQRMLREGIHLSTLIPAEPWLFDYYRSMGYAAVFGYTTHEVEVDEMYPSENITIKLFDDFNVEVYHYFDTHQRLRNCALLHTQEDFKMICADLSLANNGIFVAYQGDAIVGLSIAYDRNELIEINELMADSQDIEGSLYAAINKMFEGKKLIRYSPSEGHNNIPLGMARIINAPKVLQEYAEAFPNKEMRIRLIDAQIESNNHYFHLQGGKSLIIENQIETEYTTMDISTLCEMLFTPLHPYMNLMLN